MPRVCWTVLTDAAVFGLATGARRPPTSSTGTLTIGRAGLTDVADGWFDPLRVGDQLARAVVSLERAEGRREDEWLV